MTGTRAPDVAYDRAFYENTADAVRRSAEVIVPTVVELVAPRSVVDVGCGTGTWLSVFRAHGIEDVLGVDGDYVDRELLTIPVNRFRPADLRQSLALDRAFDLVLSLEVAEHLPGDCAATFVSSLVRLGPVVLFSAAVPFQGGTDHVNEQWPDYWARLFRTHGFVPIDCLRGALWDDDRVVWWYAQNVLLYADERHVDRHPELERASRRHGNRVPALVHPKRYLEWVEWGIEQSKLVSG